MRNTHLALPELPVVTQLPEGSCRVLVHQRHRIRALAQAKRRDVARRLSDPIFLFPAFAAWTELLAGLFG